MIRELLKLQWGEYAQKITGTNHYDLCPYIDMLAINASLFAHEDVDRRACKLPVFANLVFKITLIWVLYPLWQVAEEDERWHHRLLEHGDVLNLHKLALV